MSSAHDTCLSDPSKPGSRLEASLTIAFSALTISASVQSALRDSSVGGCKNPDGVATPPPLFPPELPFAMSFPFLEPLVGKGFNPFQRYVVFLHEVEDITIDKYLDWL